MMPIHLKAVTPAKAGVQTMLEQDTEIVWIPAFAGMTFYDMEAGTTGALK